MQPTDEYPASASIASPPSPGPAVIPTLKAEMLKAAASVGAEPATANTREFTEREARAVVVHGQRRYGRA